MWTPRGLVLSSFALNEIALPSPMSIFQTQTRYRRRTATTSSRATSRIRETRGAGIHVLLIRDVRFAHGVDAHESEQAAQVIEELDETFHEGVGTQDERQRQPERVCGNGHDRFGDVARSER